MTDQPNKSERDTERVVAKMSKPAEGAAEVAAEDELFERSKDDHAIIVGSEVRTLIATIWRLRLAIAHRAELTTPLQIELTRAKAEIERRGEIINEQGVETLKWIDKLATLRRTHINAEELVKWLEDRTSVKVCDFDGCAGCRQTKLINKIYRDILAHIRSLVPQESFKPDLLAAGRDLSAAIYAVVKSDPTRFTMDELEGLEKARREWQVQEEKCTRQR